MNKEHELFATKEVEIRFSEVDSMGVVWHGHYAMYFEDAREEFGKKYDLGYLMMYDKGFFEPLVIALVMPPKSSSITKSATPRPRKSLRPGIPFRCLWTKTPINWC